MAIAPHLQRKKPFQFHANIETTTYMCALKFTGLYCQTFKISRNPRTPFAKKNAVNALDMDLIRANGFKKPSDK